MYFRSHISYSVFHERKTRSPLLVDGERAFVSWNTLYSRLHAELGTAHVIFIFFTIKVMQNMRITSRIRGCVGKLMTRVVYICV